ncbi:MAG TPA: hypothetical protein VKA70_20300 [Blastocatellia bacterium]|nr:hypothetical protein [Blastocatellia bacterium]
MEMNRTNSPDVNSRVAENVKEEQDGNAEPPHPVEFGCLAMEVGELIYDYLIGELAKDEARIFEAHMVLCLRCQTEVATFKTIFGEWRKNPDRYFRNYGKKSGGSDGRAPAKK